MQVKYSIWVWYLFACDLLDSFRIVLETVSELFQEQ